MIVILLVSRSVNQPLFPNMSILNTVLLKEKNTVSFAKEIWLALLESNKRDDTKCTKS